MQTAERKSYLMKIVLYCVALPLCHRIDNDDDVSELEIIISIDGMPGHAHTQRQMLGE